MQFARNSGPCPRIIPRLIILIMLVMMSRPLPVLAADGDPLIAGQNVSIVLGDDAATDEGVMGWDGTNDQLEIGDGASIRVFGFIDDTAGDTDTNRTWSADKIQEELDSVNGGTGATFAFGTPGAQAGDDIAVSAAVSPSGNYRVRVWLSDSDGGAQTSTAPDGGGTAADGLRFTDGTEFEEITAEIDYSVLTGPDGDLTVTVDDDDDDNDWYVCGECNGLIDCSTVISHSSADTTPPTLSSATIGTDGETFTFVFDENVNIGTGGSSGWSITMSSAGSDTLTYSSGDGTDTLVYTFGTVIDAGETVTAGLDYTQPGDGIEDDAGNDLATIDDASVTNNSTQGGVATVDVYVDPDATGTGSGVDWTNAYTSLSAAITGEATDLVTDETCMTIHCRASSGTADTTAIVLDDDVDWTTSATYYLTIQTDATDRHPGYWDATRYRLDPSTGDYSILSELPFLRIIGMQIEAGDDKSAIRVNGAGTSGSTQGEMYVESCILRGDLSASFNFDSGLRIDNDYFDVYASNNIVIGFDDTSLCYGLYLNGSYCNMYAYNNTIIDCYNGMEVETGHTDADLIAKNNVVFDTTSGFTGTFAAGTEYNAYDTGTDPGSNGVDISGDAGADLFYAFGSADYHLAASGSSLDGAGTNLSSDSDYAISTDIDGDTRSAWSIGADD